MVWSAPLLLVVRCCGECTMRLGDSEDSSMVCIAGAEPVRLINAAVEALLFAEPIGAVMPGGVGAPAGTDSESDLCTGRAIIGTVVAVVADVAAAVVGSLVGCVGGELRFNPALVNC